MALNLQHKLFIVQKFEKPISMKKHAWMIFCFFLDMCHLLDSSYLEQGLS